MKHGLMHEDINEVLDCDECRYPFIRAGGRSLDIITLDDGTVINLDSGRYIEDGGEG